VLHLRPAQFFSLRRHKRPKSEKNLSAHSKNCKKLSAHSIFLKSIVAALNFLGEKLVGALRNVDQKPRSNKMKRSCMAHSTKFEKILTEYSKIFDQNLTAHSKNEDMCLDIAPTFTFSLICVAEILVCVAEITVDLCFEFSIMFPLPLSFSEKLLHARAAHKCAHHLMYLLAKYVPFPCKVYPT